MNQNQTREQSAGTVLAGKSRLRCFILGIFIGLAIILPGISGSTVAIILGLYTAMLYAMGHLVSKEFKECFFFLLPLGIGAVIGFLGGFIVVQKVFGPYVFEMVCLFTGLMAGAFPALLRETKGEKITVKRGVLFAVGFLLPVAIALVSYFLLPETTSEATFTDFPIARYFAYLPLGGLVSLTQIVPGLSATAVLMAFGQFGLILNSVHLDYILAHPQVLVLYVALAVGFGAGLLLLSRLLSDILAKHKATAFFMIVGLSVGSILSMFLGTDMMACYKRFASLPAFPIGTLLLGVGLFAVGFTVAYLLVLYEKKHDIAPS
ncbi:MAG: DUF368 domain-containing protein [Ruminococcaceae bacterium]|nr:DUF368 domain-containing protein [Oscillospiraceae bacterium]